MYELANFYAAAGKKAVVLTTTHIWLPNGKDVQGGAYGADWPAVASLWQQGRFAVIGTLEQGTGKLIAPAAELLEHALELCDIAIIEADGAKQMPCKLPAEHDDCGAGIDLLSGGFNSRAPRGARRRDD